MSSPRLDALGPLRHACHACGTCCEGWKVELVDRAEAARIERAALQLGIDRPIEGGALRQVDGRCVFLTDARLCRIHGELGAEVKPRVCQQFPKRATLTEAGYRVGLDPACTSTERTWRTGPILEPLPAMQDTRKLPADVAAAERGLVELAGARGATVAFFVGHFTGDPRWMPSLPPGFATRAATLLRGMDLDAVRGIQGPDVAARLAHVAPRIAGLAPEKPPTWRGALRPEHDAFALEVIRRQLFLRLGDPAVPPFAQALLLLLGTLAAAWAEPAAVPGATVDTALFPPALSAWARLVRAPACWQRLLPDLERARWLVTGA
ncbi:MAG: YkgJ family cysteine cluster protein [Deltaproteobacteria bacterium]|nr:YkgJ family cysteine cluster protein [Deltaproteobacteria bacterium]